MSDELNPAPVIPRFRRVGAALLLILIVLNFLSICYPSLRPWRSPIGLTLDIFGAILLVIPEIPYLWKHLFGGQLEQGFEKLEEFYDIPGFLFSPRVDDPSNPGYEIYTRGFDEILVVLRDGFRTMATGPGPTTNPEIDWSQVGRIGYGIREMEFEDEPPEDSDIPEEEERLILYDTSLDDEIDSFNADYIRWMIETAIKFHERRVRRFGLGLLIIGFSQQLLLSIPPVGVAAAIQNIC